MIKYKRASDIEDMAKNVAERLDMNHIDFSRLICVRSFGSKSRRTVARCHTLPKIMQMALDKNAHYVIEIISERFDKLSEEEKIKIMIHELMHIPKTFGGGFRYHSYVTEKNINEMYKKLLD